MGNLKSVLIIPIIFIIFGCDLFSEDKKAQQVKNGKLNSCPQMTLQEMAEGFMGSPSWSSIKADDGGSYVNLKGDITFHEKPVTALVQFKLNQDDTFEFQAFEINDVPQNTLIANALLTKMCSKK